MNKYKKELIWISIVALSLPLIALGINWGIGQLILDSDVFRGMSGLALAFAIAPLLAWSGFIGATVLSAVVLQQLKINNPVLVALLLGGTAITVIKLSDSILYYDLNIGPAESIAIQTLLTVVVGAVVGLRVTHMPALLMNKQLLAAAIVLVPVLTISGYVASQQNRVAEEQYYSPAKTRERNIQGISFPLFKPTYTPNDNLQLFLSESIYPEFTYVRADFLPYSLGEYGYDQLTDFNVFAPKDVCTFGNSHSQLMMGSAEPRCLELGKLNDGNMLYQQPGTDNREFDFYVHKDKTFLHLSYNFATQRPESEIQSEAMKIFNSLVPVDKKEL